MKKSILVLTVAAFITSAFLTSCNSAAEKVEIAKDKVSEASKDLDIANKEYLADIENYKKEIDERITANDQLIADLKLKIAEEKKDAKSDYKNIIVLLEQKNNDLKKKMKDYKAEGKENWVKFKSEFSYDMEELAKAFKDLTVKNVK